MEEVRTLLYSVMALAEGAAEAVPGLPLEGAAEAVPDLPLEGAAERVEVAPALHPLPRWRAPERCCLLPVLAGPGPGPGPTPGPKLLRFATAGCPTPGGQLLPFRECGSKCRSEAAA